MKENLVLNFPWQKEFKGIHPDQVSFIKGKLDDLGYRPKDYNAESSVPAKVVKATTVICTKLHELGKLDVPPWLLVVSNDLVLLQTLAKFAPIVFALSTSMPVKTTNSNRLVDLIRMSRPRGVFDSDPAGEELDDIKRNTLLWWDDITAKNNYINQGPISEILSYRAGDMLPTIFTHWDPVFTKSKEYLETQVAPKCENSIGASPAVIVLRYAVPLFIRSEINAKHFENKAERYPEVKL